MAEKSGFFNAIKSGSSYDRIYDASDFADYFSSFVGNGVFLNPANQLKVVPKSGLVVTVKTGKAFIDGYWYNLEEDMDITLSANSTSNAINDEIVCKLDRTNRVITVGKKEAVSNLLPTNNGTVHELVLAIINVSVGASSITASDITDTRPDNAYCGYVGALIEQVDFSTLFDQLESQFNDWFETIKGTLSGDVAGRLQTQINEITEKVDGQPTIRSGTDDPNNEVGVDGDVYIKIL